jgi:chromosome segregation ATPase
VSEDIVGQIKDIKGRTWQEAFYIQTKAFLEKNSEHIKEIERLKAEVEELTGLLKASTYYNTNDEVTRLKAEVERLTAFTTRTIIPNEELQKQVEALELEVFAFDRTIKQASCHYDNRLEDIRQLQAQVERLTKAGDAMASSIQFNEEMAQDYNGPTIVHQSVQRWNAAKEGKQS